MAKITAANALNLQIAVGLLKPILHTLNPKVKDWLFQTEQALSVITSADRSVYDFQVERIETVKQIVEALNKADRDEIFTIQAYFREFLAGEIMIIPDVKSEVNVLYTHENVATIFKMLEKKMGRTTQKFHQAVGEILEEIKSEPINAELT
jgi:hypothetical protein